MKKKIISLLMAVLMIAMMAPVQSFGATLQGDTDRSGTVEVYMTISEGQDGFYIPNNQQPFFLEKLSVPYFDIALYGLEAYYYNPDCYTGSAQQAGTKLTAEGVVTSMHAFIYATEKYMLELPEDELCKGLHNEELFEWISWSEGAGSSFMKFWNGSTNLNYYLEYMFPLGKPGWGSTSDQQALHDGSKIDVHLIVDKAVMGSSYSILDANGVNDRGEITEGEELTLTLKRTLSSYNDTATFAELPGVDVFYISAEDYSGQKVGSSYWTKLGTTDENAKIAVPTDLEPGVYYFSCSGEIVGSSERGPAAYILTVKEYSEVEQYGDVNGDGYVTPIDATLILQYAAEIEVEIDTAAGDVNGDGYVTPMDASYVLQYAAELITEFPVETNG